MNTIVIPKRYNVLMIVIMRFKIFNDYNSCRDQFKYLANQESRIELTQNILLWFENNNQIQLDKVKSAMVTIVNDNNIKSRYDKLEWKWMDTDCRTRSFWTWWV